MNVTQTSMEAFRSVEHELNERQEQVLDAIERYQARFGEGCTDWEISQILELPINSVTPRRGELEELGLIYCSGSVLNPSGRRAHCYKAFNKV